MNLREVVGYYGGVSQLAKAMNLSRPTVYRWAEVGIPDAYQALIEIQTKGYFRLDRRKLWRNAPHAD